MKEQILVLYEDLYISHLGIFYIASSLIILKICINFTVICSNINNISSVIKNNIKVAIFYNSLFV